MVESIANLIFCNIVHVPPKSVAKFVFSLGRGESIAKYIRKYCKIFHGIFHV